MLDRFVYHFLDAHLAGPLLEHRHVRCHRHDGALLLCLVATLRTLLGDSARPALLSGLDALSDAVAIHLRHLNICQHELKLVVAARALEFLLELSDCSGATITANRFQAEFQKHAKQGCQVGPVIIDYQNVLMAFLGALIGIELLGPFSIDKLSKQTFRYRDYRRFVFLPFYTLKLKLILPTRYFFERLL